jgi:PIN domain nuclease of toxin-antitoxin system
MGERFLLDTHTLIWWTFEQHRLSLRALAAIIDAENEIFVSAVSAMEIATKVRKGRFEIARPLATQFAVQMLREGFRLVSISADHAELAGGWDHKHRDPWDRLLAAQALVEQLTLVTSDEKMPTLGATTYW